MTRSDRTTHAAQAAGEVAAEAVQPLGLVVEDVTITPMGRRRVVRISVDDGLSELPPGDQTSTVPPVSLDEVTEASRAIGAALDEADVLGDQPYLLEVTSPGVGGRLTRWRHFRRNVGRLLTLQVRQDGVERTLTARLRAVGAEHVVVQLQPDDSGQPPAIARADTARANGAGSELTVLPWDEVVQGRVQVEFGRPVEESADEPADEDEET